MKKKLFQLVAKFNKVALPSFAEKDLTRLSKLEKAIIAFRYWITTNALD